MKPDTENSSKELPPCAMYHDCHANKDGQCTVLTSTNWPYGPCPFYKNRIDFMEGCRISLIRLLECGRTDLLTKYGCMEAYAKALKMTKSVSGGESDEVV